MRWNKSGQFYLAAAVIIILGILGFAGVSTYLKQGEPVRIFDLRDELGIESSQVLDHGIYNEQNTTELNKLLRDFTQNYSSYVERGFSLYFVFGNEDELVIAGFRDLVAGEVSVGHGQSTSGLTITRGVYNSTSIAQPPQVINITVEGNYYDFELREGENFYFVIYQKTEEGVFVEQG